MKLQCCSIALCATLAAGSAAAADPWAAASISHSPDHSPRFMLYIHKYVGTKNRKLAALSFGLGVEREISVAQGNSLLPLQMQSVRVFDFRLSALNRSGMRINGLRLGPNSSYGEDSYGEDSYGEDSYGEDSYSEDSWKNPWLWVGAGAGVVGLGCLTHTGICKKKSNSISPAPYTPPTTGT